MPLDQPLFIVVIFEFLQGGLELFDGVEGSDPEQILVPFAICVGGREVAYPQGHQML